MNYGVRSGGGIGDSLPKASFHKSSDYYIRIFFYNVSFFIIIVLVMGNVFLGIIVDSFAELRDANDAFDTDYNDVCFICQLSRDKSTSKAIDFDKHVAEKHFVWNYVYFMVYLLTNNPYDLSQIENEIYESLKKGDNAIGWIPISYY
jgi:hypothetical protein